MFMNTKHAFKKKYGPWAIVAGASEGLGAAFAESLAQKGLNLILIARRRELLGKLSEKLQNQYDIEIEICTQDLADLKSLKEYLNVLNHETGLLIYNAAFAPIGYFKDLDEDAVLKTADVNIKAPLLMIQILCRKMLDRSKGGIILMSSLSGFHGSPKISAYAASKAYNTILAEGLWREFKPHGIDITACCAGAVRTPGYTRAEQVKEAPGTMDASTVSRQCLRALGRGPVFIPGRLNRFFSFVLNRLLPGETAINIMNRNTKDLL